MGGAATVGLGPAVGVRALQMQYHVGYRIHAFKTVFIHCLFEKLRCVARGQGRHQLLQANTALRPLVTVYSPAAAYYPPFPSPTMRCLLHRHCRCLNNCRQPSHGEVAQQTSRDTNYQRQRTILKGALLPLLS